MKIKVEFEVSEQDEPGKYTWHEAIDHLAKKGDGWRLPTKIELGIMFLLCESTGDFGNGFYWSSTDIDEFDALGIDFYEDDTYNKGKIYEGKIRAVRDIA